MLLSVKYQLFIVIIRKTFVTLKKTIGKKKSKMAACVPCNQNTKHVCKISIQCKLISTEFINNNTMLIENS